MVPLSACVVGGNAALVFGKASGVGCCCTGVAGALSLFPICACLFGAFQFGDYPGVERDLLGYRLREKAEEERRVGIKQRQIKVEESGSLALLTIFFRGQIERLGYVHDRSLHDNLFL